MGRVCPYQDIVFFATADELVEWLENQGACKHLLSSYYYARATSPAGLAYLQEVSNEILSCSCPKPKAPAYYAATKDDAAHELAHLEMGGGHDLFHKAATEEALEHINKCLTCRERFKELRLKKEAP